MTVTQEELLSREELLRRFASSLVAAGGSEEKLLATAARSCRDLLQAADSSVWLIDPDRRNLVLRAAVGYQPSVHEDIGQLSYPLERPDGQPIGITAWIYVHQQPVSADSYEELRSKPGYRGQYDPELHAFARQGAREVEQHPCQQFYGGPISLGDEHFGVLKVENKTGPDPEGKYSFSEADKAVLDTVAALLAMALSLARANREIQDQMGKYHSFMLRAIRNEIMPIETARDLLVEMEERGHAGKEELAEPLRFLRSGIAGVEFYLNKVLRFLRDDFDPGRMQPVRIWTEVVQREIWYAAEARGPGDLSILNETHGCEDCLVKGDREFLDAAVKEVLRNAVEAVLHQRAKAERSGVDPKPGLIKVELRRRPADRSIAQEHLCITVSDNGDAARDPAARKELEEAWQRAQETPSPSGSRHVGLSFVKWVIESHGGYVELSPPGPMTSLNIHLPIVGAYAEGAAKNG
jgi:signal transduction histidine kinase